MKKICVLINLIVFCCVVYAQDFCFSFKNIPTFKMTMRANYRTYQNDKYTGLVSKEYKSILDVKNVDEKVFSISGTSFFLDQTLYNQKLIGYTVDEVVKTNYWIYSDGVMSVSDTQYPYIRNIPYFLQTFKPDEIYSQVGSYVSIIKVGDKTNKYVLPTTVVMRYSGENEIFGKKCDLFEGSFIVKTSPVYKEIKNITGKHNLRIFFDNKIGMPAYIEDYFTDNFTITDNSVDTTIKHDGFYLYFYEPYRKLRINLTSQDIKQDLIANPDIEKNVEVKEAEDGVILVVKNLHFSANSAEIDNSQHVLVAELAKILQKQKDKMILITGHTAKAGSEDEQKVLSYVRAKAVAQALVDKNVNPKNLMIEGKGATQPLAPNDSDENMAKNRRVEIKILGR